MPWAVKEGRCDIMLGGGAAHSDDVLIERGVGYLECQEIGKVTTESMDS